jgi:hypothetical protein
MECLLSQTASFWITSARKSLKSGKIYCSHLKWKLSKAIDNFRETRGRLMLTDIAAAFFSLTRTSASLFHFQFCVHAETFLLSSFLSSKNFYLFNRFNAINFKLGKSYEGVQAAQEIWNQFFTRNTSSPQHKFTEMKGTSNVWKEIREVKVEEGRFVKIRRFLSFKIWIELGSEVFQLVWATNEDFLGRYEASSVF